MGLDLNLCLSISLWGEIQTIDHKRKLKYTQEFKNNLSIIQKPTIISCTKTAPYTKISFLPDYKRFGLKGLTQDMFQLFRKRTYDIAAITAKTVRVSFNNQLVPIRSFENYIDLFIGPKEDATRIHEKT